MAKSPGSVLIVDDSATIRRMVRAALESLQGMSFVEAANGLEALEQLALNPVNAVVLDLNMPDMHGLEVLTFVRRHPKYRTLPVLILTTRGDEQSREAARHAGASDFLTKPFSPQVIADRVRALLDSPRSAQMEEGTRVEP